jgi:hypothetical protein
VRPLLLILAVALAVTGSAAARNPRLEHLALRPGDMDLARGAVLRGTDLGTGWTGRTIGAGANEAPDCPGQDYSKYTITGQAQAQFSKQGASVISRIEVYPSHAQVLGDFAVDSRTGTAACEGAAVRRQIAKQANGVRVRLLSARQVAGPKVGQKSIAFRIVLSLEQASTKVRLYVDLIGFVRDRAAASVVVVAPGLPPKGNDILARMIDTRLRRAA